MNIQEFMIIYKEFRIALARKFAFSKETLRPEEYKFALAESEMNLSIDLLHLHLEHRFAANLFMIKSFMNFARK